MDIVTTEKHNTKPCYEEYLSSDHQWKGHSSKITEDTEVTVEGKTIKVNQLIEVARTDNTGYTQNRRSFKNRYPSFPDDAGYIKIGSDKKPLEKNWQKTPYSKADLESWYDQHPDVLGIGLLLGHQGVIAIDLDGHGAIEKIKQLTGKSTLEEIFGHTVAVTSGIPYRCQFFYRVPPGLFEDLTCSTISTNRKTYIKPDHKIKTDQIEFRYRGHQSVLDGNHPITGYYRFLPGHSFADFDEIPQLPPLLIDMITKLHNKDIQQALALLPQLDADDYHTWTQVGMALKSLSHSHSIDLYSEWLNWSKESTKFKSEQECSDKWNSFPLKPDFNPLAKLKHLSAANVTTAAHNDKDNPETTKQRIVDTLQQGLSKSDLTIELQKIKQDSSFNLDKDFNHFVNDIKQEHQPQNQKKKQKIPFESKSFEDVEITEKSYLVDALKIRKEWLYLLTAPPKTGKSVLATNISACMAKGKPFLGYKCEQGKVLYLSLDEPETQTKENFISLGIADGDADNKNLVFVFDIPRSSTLDFIDSLDATLERDKPDIVVIDSLIKMFQSTGLDENKQEAGDFIAQVYEVICQTHNAAGIIISHTSKSDKNGSTAYNSRGHSSIEGHVGGTFLLLEKTSNKNYRKLTYRGRGYCPDLEFTFNNEEEWSSKGAFSLTSNKQIQEASSAKDKIYHLICVSSGLTNKQIVARLDVDIKIKTVNQYLSKMKAESKVIDKDGYWYVASEPSTTQYDWDTEALIAEMEEEERLAEQRWDRD